MKKIFLRMTYLLLVFVFSFSGSSFATTENSIISIGADLSENQKSQMIEELDGKNSKIIEITNEEELKYLGDLIPREKIGNKALSCSKITLSDDISGIDLKLKNINYISESTYRNALATAGIENAEVIISAPMSVSGTGALTGIFKSYETLTGKKISDDVKKIANEELLVTTDFAKQIGESAASDLINIIKVEISKNFPRNRTEIQDIIVDVSKNYDLNLTGEQIDKLTNLFENMTNADIDWEKVSETAQKYSNKAIEYLSSEEGQSFLETIKNIIVAFFDWLINLFKK